MSLVDLFFYFAIFYAQIKLYFTRSKFNLLIHMSLGKFFLLVLQIRSKSLLSRYMDCSFKIIIFR